MARNTDRNNIKPMFRLVVFPMVILFSLIGAITTSQSPCRIHFAISDGIANGITGLNLQIVFLTILFSIRDSFLFASVGLLILFLVSLAICLTVFALPIFSCCYTSTRLASPRKSIFCAFILVKFNNGFSLFANRTLFCYNLLRHNRFLNKRLLLEPYAEPISVCGSLYSKLPILYVNNF